MPLKSTLIKEVHPLNIFPILVTDEVSMPPNSKLTKDVHPLNIFPIFITVEEVSNPLKSTLSSAS